MAKSESISQEYVAQEEEENGILSERKESRMVALGDRVQDALTHYRGVVVAITEWLYGGREVAVQNESLKDGKPRKPHWFEENRLIHQRTSSRRRAAA